MINAIILFGLLLRIIVAIWNGFYGPSFQADGDALNFHNAAVEYSQDLIMHDFKIGWIYSNFLGIFYHFTAESLFLGSLLSCFSWLASAYVLIAIMHLLPISKGDQFKAMLIYSLLPSSLAITSITLREPYQLLFINLVIYAGLKIYLNKSTLAWFILIFGLIGMGVLHYALIVFGVFVMLFILIMLGIRRKNFLSLTLLCIFLCIITIFGMQLFSSVAPGSNDGFVNAVINYQKALVSIDARANYRFDVEINGIINFILFNLSAFFQYLFEPMPWRISSGIDLVIFFENILRLWLIWRLSTSLLNAVPYKNLVPILFIFLSYFFLELIWSVGVANWGTAIRHHITAIGLLVVGAFISYKNSKASYLA
jgi:hypothetical protein